VVTAVNNRSRANADAIVPGDVITHIDDIPYREFIDSELRPHMSFSNTQFLYRMARRFRLLFGGEVKVKVSTVSKSGIVTKKVLTQYDDLLWEDPYGLITGFEKPVVSIDSNIIYVNLGKVNSAEYNEVFKGKRPKDLILDLRNYPETLPRHFDKYFLPRPGTFAKLLTPHSPGYAEYDVRHGLHKLINVHRTGSNNPDYFKGRIILLVDSSTASLSEQYGMRIQIAPDVTTIGSQTAGAVLSVTRCLMPDSSEITYTYAGAFYPDGTSVQRDGLKIDHYVRESAIHYDPDLYIKEAIKILKGEITSLNKSRL
jgi:carboxyl-terminal processing protease